MTNEYATDDVLRARYEQAEIDGFIARSCISCGTLYFDQDIEPCRGERKDPPWCNGRHNCPWCRLRGGIEMLLAGRQGGYDDKFGPDEATIEWWDGLPDTHPLKFDAQQNNRFNDVMIEDAFYQARKRLEKKG